MEEKLLPFKKFYNKNIALEIKELLEVNQIDCVIEENYQPFSPSISGTPFENEINLKIKPKDFNKGREVLLNYYNEAIKAVGTDYYLFEFSVQELIEIISKPDEWGEFDYLLAKKILSDRGKEIKPEVLRSLDAQRIKHLSKVEKTSKHIIYKGYLGALLGGIGAIFLGYGLAHGKKIMPNGEHIYNYSEEERKHGERIFLLGCISLVVWVILILFVKSQEGQQ